MKNRIRQSKLAYSLLWQMTRLRHPAAVADSAAWWQRTRNRHAGRRGFVIGNGPSLKVSDLSRLGNDVCIASNKIYLAFEETAWRPQYFSCGDKLVWVKIQGDIPKWFTEVITINTMNLGIASIRPIIARHLGGHASDTRGFSTDLGQGVYGGKTVTYTNLQLAVHLGLNPIYLIGCDHYYSGETDEKVRGECVQHSGTSNHFNPNYRTPGEKVNIAPIEEMNAAFSVARRETENAGIRIFNATRGGYLNIFERADLDAVLAAS